VIRVSDDFNPGGVVRAGGLTGERGTVSPPGSTDFTPHGAHVETSRWRRFLAWLLFGHQHDHVLFAVSYPPVGVLAVFGAAPSLTYLLYRCPCNHPGHLVSQPLPGRWTLDQARGLLPPA
jgi:hypothetical protein